MSKRYSNHNRSSNKPHAVRKAQTVTAREWDNLAGDRELKGAYVRLASEIERAYGEAETLAARSGIPAEALLDLSQAQDMLMREPRLARFLYDVRDNGAPFSTKASPVAIAQERNDAQGLGDLSGWTGDKHAPQGVINARLFRKFADENEWTRAAINHRRQQVGRANISVAPADERKKFDKKVQYRIQQMLEQPNEYRTTYYELIGAACEDLLVLDRGCISKDMTVDRMPVNLYYEDGGSIKIYANWSGDPSEPRYLWQEPGGRLQVPLRNDELICISANPASYRFGLSPVQVLMNTIKADIEATKTATRMVEQKPPPQMIHLQGASGTQIRKLRDKYDSDIAGEKEIFFLGSDGPVTAVPLIWSAKDQQFLEWQVYLARKICALFQISPQQIGITFDINKATAEVQQDISEDAGLIPLLLLFEEYFNRELLGDFAPQTKDGRVDLTPLNLRILYPEISEADRMLHAKEAIAIASQALAGLPSMTWNQVAAMWGEEPIKGGNTLWVMTANGPMPWLSYDGETGDYTPSSTAGERGSQDALGGPSADENTTEVRDQPDDMTDNGTQGTQSGGENAGGASTQVTGGDAGAGAKQLRLLDVQDYRAIGRRWSPAIQRSKRREAHALGRVPEHLVLAHHEPLGKIKAREDMRQATLDFYGTRTDAVVKFLEAVGKGVRGKLPPAEELRAELGIGEREAS